MADTDSPAPVSATVCMGCGGALIAGVHRIADEVTGDEIGWHPDCHVRTANGCTLCSKIVAAFPDLKDADLGAAILADNPNIGPVNHEIGA